MEMTFQQYIDNPMGKKNAVFSQRGMYKEMYSQKFDALYLREAGKIDYTLYIDKPKGRYIIHVKIPSEGVKGLFYDSVICFFTSDPAVKASPSLKDYYVQFFTNDPAFAFTYIRVFLKNKLLFEDMKPRIPRTFLKVDPVEKNAYETPGYSKVLYFTYLFMKLKNLFSKPTFEAYAQNYSTSTLLSRVENVDKKIEQSQVMRKEQAKEKRLAKATATEKAIANQRVDMDAEPSNLKVTRLSNKAKSVKIAPQTSRVRTTKAVKYTSRIK